MLWGGNLGALELRSEGGATRLRATFPYGAETELAPGRREVIASRAFSDRIEAGEDIHLLSGHDYNKPLASRAAGNLTLADGDDALVIEATIADGTTWARDFLAAHAGGLIRGLSPGFRVDLGGERIERRGNSVLRTISPAALFELSAVTRPAYSSAQIEARAWETHQDRQPYRGAVHHLNRWRL
ncbi:MAG: HK97 family phage prohead protease [Paracoccus sp. (in: a-proteobacteria)]|uniref:HK97 family phage prohead protease n=1 Tax=unclassified Paracoccus (in: a-proteobacteria) TaxID=2688777 RepID=UPI000C449233|nr:MULTISPECIES: HK97 family phage prohead protease [unclassified Paracoccus (in: a-proteobacteria)]MBA49128.1 HK97 family phage prohead protease [Paracoccus sp. (in: a-proteobacteria)]|tara:strand:+ start:3597 stop:4151 length:555 start_codon:yes stop_codon:yes gene_type:complete